MAIAIASISTQAQSVEMLKQHNLAKWHIKPANYSGITHIDSNLYAVIDDKSSAEGFYLFHIEMDLNTGKVLHIDSSPLIHPANPDKASVYADCEDIVYVPATKTVFISHEATARVKEYTLDGQLTGRGLHIPTFMNLDHQQDNGGFEALAYNPKSQTFWLTTENSLKADSMVFDRGGMPHQLLRIVEFDKDLTSTHQYPYLMEEPQLHTEVKYYTHGVPAMTALPDGRLLVMERELSIPPDYLGGKSQIRIFVVNPSNHKPATTPLNKKEVASFTTHIKVGKLNYANYEGMCLGPTLTDGRQTLLLINDSQAGAGNFIYKLKDYIKVIILPRNF